MKRPTEVIIIGAGITGLATALNYKQQAPGRSVTIVDKVEAVASPMQASSVNCGILCHESTYSLAGD